MFFLLKINRFPKDDSPLVGYGAKPCFLREADLAVECIKKLCFHDVEAYMVEGVEDLDDVVLGDSGEVVTGGETAAPLFDAKGFGPPLGPDFDAAVEDRLEMEGASVHMGDVGEKVGEVAFVVEIDVDAYEFALGSGGGVLGRRERFDFAVGDRF